MTRQFDEFGIEFETFDAIDWRDLSEKDCESVDRKARYREGRRALSQGMIACHLSHRKAIESVALGDTELAAIFEDDASLTSRLACVFQALDRGYSLGTEFDIVFLHRNRTYLPFVPICAVGDNVKLGITKYSDWGVHSYVISRNAARRILELHPRIVHRCDHTLHAYWENGLNVFSLEDPAVFHGNKAGNHSFLREGTDRPSNGGIARLPRRVCSLLQEEFLKREFFFRRLQDAKAIKMPKYRKMRTGFGEIFPED